jgi:hypothetical protein
MTFTVEHVRRRPGAALPAKTAPPPARRPMSRLEIADALAAIKDRARRLCPPLNDRPNQWHEDKSDLVQALCEIEDAVRGNRPLKSAEV